METLFPLLFQWVAPGVLALVGLWHLLFPLGPWKLGRLSAQSEGLATADEPTPGALTLIRIRGVFFLVIAVVFAVSSYYMFAGFGS